MDDSTGEERRTRNEATFRDANEGIKAFIDDQDFHPPLAPFLCECGDESCRQLIRVPLETYSEVRKFPRRFILATGHDRRDGTETSLVETHEGFVVVEKVGSAGKIAAERAEEGASVND